MQMWETAVLQWLQSLRGAVLTPLFEGITVLAEETVLVLVLAVLFFAFDKAAAKRLLFITMASMTLNGVVKNLVQRPRPFEVGAVSGVRTDTATGFSFPSGHTQNLATWSTAGAWMLRRTWAWILSAVLIAAVAVSRMFLGAHYPSDVLVGAVLGVGLSMLGSALYDRVKNTSRLYLVTSAVLLPFAVGFAFVPDPRMADFYKFYGMLAGLAAAAPFEERFVKLELTVPLWKKAVRIAAVIAAVLGIKLLFACIPAAGVWVFVSDFARSAVMILAALGLCPWAFKRLHL